MEKNNINSIIKKATENVPFYKDLYLNTNSINKKLDELPLVDKKMLIDSQYALTSKKYNILDKNIFMTKTSGSTGLCLDVYWSINDYRHSLIELWVKRKKYYNINPDDKLCVFFSSYYMNPVQKIAYGKNCIMINKLQLNNDNLPELYNKICEYDPKWMILQPSIAIIICQFIKKNNLCKNPSLKYVELTGELLSVSQRNLISEVLNCSIANQYGCTEVNSIAYECPEGNMHISKNTNYVEIINDDHIAEYGEEGMIYVTSLKNNLMPFIRYCTGDSGIKYPSSQCNCGCCGDILELKKARATTFIRCDNGEKVSTYIFVNLFDYINAVMDNIIIQYQVLQKNYKKFVVNIALDNPSESSYDQEQIISMFYSQLNQMNSYFKTCNFIFKFYDNLFPEECTGKLSFFKSFVENAI